MTDFVNLLPWSCRKAQVVRLRLVQWSVIFAVVGGLTAAACVVTWDQWRAGHEQEEQLEQAYAPTSAMLAEIKTLGRRLEQLRARQAVVAQLESSRPALSLLGFVSQSARECEGRLRVEELSVLSSQLPVAGSPSPVTSQRLPTDNRQLANDNCHPATSVAIKGIAMDDLAVARFVLALRQTKAFDRVELKSSQGQGPADGGRGTGIQGSGVRAQGPEPRSLNPEPSAAPRFRSYAIECGY